MTAALYGYAIEAPFPLRRARSAPSMRGCLRIEEGTDLLERDGELVSWSDTGGSQFALAASREELLAWCSSTGAYVLDGPRGRIIVDRHGDSEGWEHRFGSTMVPLMLAERGDLALHAAAVADAGRAIIVCGPTGRGKSTIAAALAAQGYAILSDDGVVVSEPDSTPLAWPGPTGITVAANTAQAVAPSMALTRTENGRKALGFVSTRDVDAAPVAAILLLDARGGDVARIESVDRATALRALMPHLIYGGRRRIAATLTIAGPLVERVSVFRVRLPERLDRIGEAAANVVQAVSRRDPADALAARA